MAALKLTMAFIVHSKYLLQNFETIQDYWSKHNMAEKDKNNVFPVLLQSLFMLVPVISTTFASVSSFLKNVKEPGTLGTLIVDEAGQAQPHMLVGALYRCQSAVIVGDPKQVEPVVTEDLKLIRNILFENKWEYQDVTASVQSYADSLNHIGTFLGDDEDELWVGSPLRVHRRCVSPMFDISNELSYSGFMINSTYSKFNTQFPEIPSSAWYDIHGKTKSGKQFVEEQGTATLNIIKSYIQLKNNIIKYNKRNPEQQKKLPTLYVISPFKAVVNEIKIKLHKNNISDMNDNIGTVHTFQGKEADIVIFVLGCDAEKKGAVKWVNSNIVNVAVTRAKNRLYVIGDVSLWETNPNLATLITIFKKNNCPIQSEILPLFKDNMSSLGQVNTVQTSKVKKSSPALDRKVGHFKKNSSSTQFTTAQNFKATSSFSAQTVTVQHTEKNCSFPDQSKGGIIVENRTDCPICHKDSLERFINKKNGRIQYKCTNPNCKSMQAGEPIYYEEKNGKPLICKCVKCQDYSFILVERKSPLLPYWFCKKCHDKQLLRKEIPDFYKNKFK